MRCRCRNYTASNRAGKLENWKTGKLENWKTGKLENWKSEKLTSGPPTWPARISGFQDFRFSPLHLPTEILRLGADVVVVGVGRGMS
jgi:hypothetical protein